MEQNKDQGAAVRALPSDLTEREQIDLLCQVENYMSITEKHSQTAPEAVAEETRMYGMVNSFIAKRFSDIGAAVRGEAVAGLDGWKIGNACNGSIVIQKEGLGGCLAERDSESIAESILYELACSVRYAPVSARTADSHAEPSEPPRLDTEQSREYLVTFMEQHFTDTTFHRYIRGQIGGSGPLAGDFAWQMARALRRIEAGVVKSRAADAPSEPSVLAMRAVLLNAKAVIKRWDSPLWRQEVGTAEFVNQLRNAVELAESRAADALDSQPTDDKRDDLIARLRHQVDELNGRLFDLQTGGQSTIRPTTKQLIAQLHDDQKWTIAEQNAIAEFLTRFPNESSQGMISLGDAWKHGQAYERARASSQPTDGGVRNG